MSGGLETVQTLLEQVLEKHGISTVGAWDRARLPALSGAAAVLGVQETQSGPAALWNYLGQQWDAERGEIVERYGRVLELKLYVDFYAPHGSAAEIEKGFEMLEKELFAPLAEGLRADAVQRGEIGADGKSGYLKGRCTVACRAYFTAVRAEEGAALTDFHLKGVVQ
ncbi:MAG: hypothetical protein KHW65_07435 [Clostridiales bacterium]|nr:hypothetical protein [Clostridiales bacterium]